MRGIPPGKLLQIANSRFIPADAGNTKTDSGAVAMQGVHPRGCGEYSRRHEYACRSAGSSPRMRGILLHGHLDLDLYRFIPADAGNTAFLAWAAMALPVHPRGCGEYTALRTTGIAEQSVHPRGCGEYNKNRTM